MITGKRLRAIRWQAQRPARHYDSVLAEAAEHAAKAGRPHYSAVQNPTTQSIYRYLCDFVAAVASEQFGCKPGDIKILDWGGGKGYATYFLKQQGFDVTLFEMSGFAHKDLWRQLSLPVKTGDSPTLPFKDGSFDVVLSFGVLEHVPYDYDALKEVNRLLKDDGLFMCFNLPNQYGYLHHYAAKRGVRYHDRLYTARETRQLLKRAGFNYAGKPWRRQLFPKNSVTYKSWRAWEWLDLALCRYTPLGLLATSLEFVARKQYTYTSEH